ncbi:mycofactocin-coupled SDR family oxidoreductase [Rhodococcus sp. USK10]|uniref:Short chain dehydrogenase n=1 Tax=Rhodococcus wratislaviensis TaxID=44752 RepID=A0A402CEU0_RHOWR|nr:MULTISPECIES: mycofactocin-coupled SDR family oxidoreductase [Rhodococcus]QYB07132.1 mycofactocin-coupled SDR family oxidoreductase [Rhodococcus sp. USK10]GCE42105.1 short chain dehydrogenase [Rhodococcus wratislaviensis]
MSGTLEGKVAFITGAARGQGRSHAIRLAEEGADIIAVDICRSIETVPYSLATEDDLAETVALVEKLDRRIVARTADVRDKKALSAALEAGATELGGVDIVVANAGIAPQQAHERDRDAVFADVIGVNLVGVFNTVEVARERMIAQGRGGSIVMTSSTAGIKAVGGSSGAGIGYTASKHGVVGLMRQYAVLLAEHNIRVNSVHPTGVSTPMVVGNTALAGALADPTNMGNSISNLLPIDILEPEEISNAVAWLVSDESRYVTGVMLPVDAGLTIK